MLQLPAVFTGFECITRVPPPKQETERESESKITERERQGN